MAYVSGFGLSRRPASIVAKTEKVSSLVATCSFAAAASDKIWFAQIVFLSLQSGRTELPFQSKCHFTPLSKLRYVRAFAFLILPAKRATAVNEPHFHHKGRSFGTHMGTFLHTTHGE